MRTPRKPGTVSTKAVASENIDLCVPCQGTGQAGCPGAAGSWDGAVLTGIPFHGHPDTSKCSRGTPSPQGHAGDAQCPTGLQTAPPAPAHSL